MCEPPTHPPPDPSNPVYVDTSVMMGMTGEYNEKGFDNIVYMECKPDNKFFPDLSKVRLNDNEVVPDNFPITAV